MGVANIVSHSLRYRNGDLGSQENYCHSDTTSHWWHLHFTASKILLYKTALIFLSDNNNEALYVVAKTLDARARFLRCLNHKLLSV